MSAYMCGQKTLTALAVWLLKECPDGVPSELKQELDSDGFERTRGGYERTIARIIARLAAENLRSLEARYPGQQDRDAIIQSFGRFTRDMEREAKALPVLTVIKTAHHYAYQSCEHNGWEDSQAKRMVDGLERRLVRKLPGYDDAPWGLD